MAEDEKKPEDSTDADQSEGGDDEARAAGASGSAAAASASGKDADDDGEDEDEDEDGEDGEEEEDAAPPAPAKSAKQPEPAPEPARKSAKARPAAEPEPARPTSPRKRAPLPPEPPPAALGKTVTIFVVAMGGLSAGFYLLGAETGGDKTAPRWKNGQTVDVNITLVASDRNELACASDVVIADRRCEFVNKTKPAEKTEDAKLLKPYTTTDNVQFLGAGLWSQPDLEVKKLPADRFTVKCKFTVEGEIKKPAIRWATRGGFSDKENNWYAGALKECSLAP